MPPDTLNVQTPYQQHFNTIRANDEKALRAFYQHNYPKVERYVLNNNGTEDEARDIYQEAFIAVWRNIQLNKFEPQHETALDGYLFQIAKNKWLDHLRAIKRKPVVAMNESAEYKNEHTGLSDDEEEQINSIKANFKLLGEMCRNVLERFYYQKQSMRVISSALNWTEATAKNNKYRCLQRLRELLKTNQPNLE